MQQLRGRGHYEGVFVVEMMQPKEEMWTFQRWGTDERSSCLITGNFVKIYDVKHSKDYFLTQGS